MNLIFKQMYVSFPCRGGIKKMEGGLTKVTWQINKALFIDLSRQINRFFSISTLK